MLQSLHVKNLALVQEAEINFTDGFNVLTGETGAGKSIIIGSIIMALGGRASGDMIRNGAAYALCELEFKITDKDKIALLKEMGIEELEEGNLVISRKIAPARSSIKVNGETFSVGEVKQIAEILIDIHGQHEHQLLLNENKHLDILDRFAGEKAAECIQQIDRLYREYTKLCSREEALTLDEASRAREISFIEFEVNEITDAGLKAGEDEELEIQFKRMSNALKITKELSAAYQLLEGDEGGITDRAGIAAKSLLQVLEYDKALEDVYNILMDIESMAVDAARAIEGHMEDLEFQEESYNEVSSRLTLLNHLKMKYGNTVEEILQYCEKRQEELNRLNHIEEELEKISAEKKRLERALEEGCAKLTDIRKAAAEELSDKIKTALCELNFLQVCFDVAFERLDGYTAKGWDKVSFLISTNPGESLKPLKAVASGGEMSRIMLAVKAVLAATDDIDTLIFDEIDSGISGVTAGLVADKMCEIASGHQVICITHLSQIAAMADSHFLIEKSADASSTTTTIRRLDFEESIRELARILGGNHITEAVLQTAREIKKNNC